MATTIIRSGSAPLAKQLTNVADIPASIANAGVIDPQRGVASNPNMSPMETLRQLEGSGIPPELPTVQRDFIVDQPLDRAPGQFTAVPAMDDATISMIPQRIPPEQVGVDVDMANTRLSSPTSLPDLTDPGTALSTLKSAELEVQPSFDALNYDQIMQDNSKKSGFPARSYTNLPSDKSANEANMLSTWAGHFSSKLGSSGSEAQGIFANPDVMQQLNNDVGASSRPSHELASGVLLTFARVADDIRTRRYAKQVAKETDTSEPIMDEDGDFDYTAMAERERGKPKATPEERLDLWKSAVGEIQSQPVIQGLVNGVGTAFGRLLSRPAAPESASAPTNISPLTASALAYSFYEDGFIDIAKDKYGRFYPYLTDTGNAFASDTTRASILYDPEQRHTNINAPVIRSVSAPTKNLAYANLQDSFMPDGRVIGGDYTIQEKAALFTGAVALGVHQVTHSLLKQQIADVEAKMVPAMPDGSIAPPGAYGVIQKAYSTSVFAKTMSDYSRGKFIEKIRELQASGATPEDIQVEIDTINTNKLNQDKKHINEYIAENAVKGPRYDVVKLSEATLRMFGTAIDVNVINHSGTIRPAAKFSVESRARVNRDDVLGHINKAHAMANRVYNTQGAKGIQVGHSVHRALMALSPEDRAMLGAMYQIAKVAHDMGYLQVPGNRSTPDVYIKALNRQAFEQVAKFGALAKQWSMGGMPTTDGSVELPPAFSSLSELFTKKEWSPIITNAVMAHDIQVAAKNGTTAPLTGVLESDASQSNAFIISLLIGDPAVSAILGNSIGGSGFDQLRADFKDLRNKAASTLSNDIDETFIGKDDAGIKAAMLKLFSKARAGLGSSFDKAYARGIVVAGLYGKNPTYMFTEVETMLSLFSDVVSNDIEDIQQGIYNNDRKAMLEDMAAIYATSMRKHMANLQGYQRAVSAIGALKAAFDGSTEVQSFGKTKINIGLSSVVPYDDETGTAKELFDIDGKMPLTSQSATNLSAPGDYGRGIKDISDMKERLKETNMQFDDFMLALTEYTTPGDKAKKALPVTLIQSGDSFQMGSAIVYANKDTKGLPLNIKSVHDAGITDPSSTLLFINAYNNVSPYIMSANAEHILGALKNSLVEDQKNAMLKVRADGYADIGMRGRFKSMGGYLDRLYAKQFMIGRAKKMGREAEADKERSKIGDKADKMILNAVMALTEGDAGWLPPIEQYRDKRNHRVITPRQFKLISQMLREHSGFLLKGEQPLVLKGADFSFATTRNLANIDKFIAHAKLMSLQMANNERMNSNTK